jgi:hypothetical protein
MKLTESCYATVISFGFSEDWSIFKTEPDRLYQKPQKPTNFQQFCNPWEGDVVPTQVSKGFMSVDNPIYTSTYAHPVSTLV